jgi:1-acyl-sn-glycerol-3-phosphate acyltransferase
MNPKPRAELIRPEITELPRLTRRRKVARRLIIWLLRALVRLCTRTKVTGVENVPPTGGVIMAANHLGDADVVIGLAFTPREADLFAKAELYDYPLLGKIFEMYGVIWVHRGFPDRRALRAALEGLAEGRAIGIAPEGRESLSGALEEGTGGAAYLALKGEVPVVPITFTGTENAHLYGNLKRLRRTEITMTIGVPFRLEKLSDRRKALEKGTEAIMSALAQQLPEHYRGVYR